MENPQPPYTYKPITPDSFRCLKLLSLHPQLTFRLVAFPIHSAQRYTALSYAWGTAPEEEDAICNGASYRLSRTLGRALRGIHTHTTTAWLWVDAICINQADDAEKAHQVAGMGALYASADRVVIWLGDAADDSALACALLPELTDRIWALTEDSGGWKPRGTGDIVARGLPPPEDRLWRAAFLLYSREWFQRLWIVQEIVLARECVFVCGRGKLGWDVVVNFAVATSKSVFVGNIAGLHVRAMGERAYRSTVGIRLVRNAWRLQRGLEEGGSEGDGLQAVMDVMQSQGAYLEVDYVYAVRGMLSEALRGQVVVDYSEEVKRNYGMVHARFFKQCLERLRDWPSLHFPPATHADVPSWCPPWGSGWNNRYLPMVGCRAGRPTPSSKGLELASDEGEVGILHIAGVSVDTVREIVPLDLRYDEETHVLHTGAILRCIKDCLARVPDGADARQALPGVLIGQCGWLETSAFSSPPDGDLLDSLFAFLEPLAANEEHEGEEGYAPVNLDTAEYILDEHRFWRAYLNLIMVRWPDRSFALTTMGRLAMVSCETKPGDTVCVFLGATLPQIVSRKEDDVYWRYIGPGVVDGIMNGETFDKDDWLSKKEVFSLT